MPSPQSPRDNPILNNPYEAPKYHYATDASGNLDYTRRLPGRRVFVPDTPIIPVGQSDPGLFDINELEQGYRPHLVNLIRQEVGAWRDADYPGVTSRVTRLPLDYWFANPERSDPQRLFFAQREALKDPADVIRRILGKGRTGRRLLVINDEAHHCYLPKARGKKDDDEDSVTENARAAVWFSGLRALAARYELRAVYDLSATPYYLQGSGYPAYSLFPWVCSDFGLVEAIESGLVKIPFLPVADSSQDLDQAVLRNIYDRVRDELPRKGQRKRTREDPETLIAPPRLPPLVKQALNQFYDHYDKYQSGVRELGERAADLLTEPPVFILVCNNTSVSREVYKEIAGYDYSGPDGRRQVVPGKYPLFSNFDPVTGQPRVRPPTLLIDSDALDQGDQIDADFKAVFAAEIEQFRHAYRRRHPDRAADLIDEGTLLREVVNTVGKPGSLGAHVRCVVSVSMLTEGWDANTVTHIFGLRAFGSQLLCEQVAGRALRRRHYFLDPKTHAFPPEYAHIIGVPFKVFKGGPTPPPPPVETPKHIQAVPGREALEVRFPNVIGYRIDQDLERLAADFSDRPCFDIDFTARPLESTLGNAFSPEKERLQVRDVLEVREQEILYYPVGSSRQVWGETRKDCFETAKSRVNRVVQDSGWEGKAAKELEQHPAVDAYVKNSFLGFVIPYEKDGKARSYYPDFIARIRLTDARLVNLIIEITGMNQDKAEKRWTVENRWLPAVNGARDQLGTGEWAFIDIANDARIIRNALDEKIASLTAGTPTAGTP